MSKRPASPLAYGTALGLNNMAITLIQKGYFSQALRTLNESLVLMKAAFQKNFPCETIKPQETFQTAYSRYTRTLKNHDDNVAKPSSLYAWAAQVDIDVLDDNDFAAVRAAARYGPSSSVYFPVRISESCSSSGMDGDAKEIARQLGIILYNHGIANLLVAKQHQDSSATATAATADVDKVDKLKAKSLKSLEMADFTIASILEEQADDSSAVPLDELSLVLLSALILNGLSLAFHQQGLKGKAEETLRVVSDLCSCIDRDCFASMMVEQSRVAAAA